MGGGEVNSSHSFEESSESLLNDQNLQTPDGLSSKRIDIQREILCVNEGFQVKFHEFEDLNHWVSSDSLDSEILQLRRHKDYEEIMLSYDNGLKIQVGRFDEAKLKLLSYKPGAWTEEVGCMKMSNYDVPKTTTLILIGPRGSGKSSLVNRISRVFDDDKFTSERAQVSYNSSVGDGTLFLHEYMIPRGSTSFCLYDTRSLSENSYVNFEMIKNWMTKGVRHGELVLRDSDSSRMRNSMKCKARQTGYSGEMRKVNFVIFVVNALSVLKSMDGEDNMQYTRLLGESFRSPYLSFKDDKPVVVSTHGDLLSYVDRARVRIYLGELLGIPPAKQFFDIPEKCDPETDRAVVDMLTYSLMHADKNIPGKSRSSYKVLGVLMMMTLVCVCLFAFCSTSLTLKLRDWCAIWHLSCSSKNISENPINFNVIPVSEFEQRIHINWHEIRHLWEG